MFRPRSMGASVRTYLRPSDLDGNNYRDSFSPSIYPGQTLRARMMAHRDAHPDLIARLFVRDANTGERIEQSPGTPLQPGKWTTVTWRIPPMTGACLDQAGVLITDLHPARIDESVYFDELDWSGGPDFTFDFRREWIETEASSQWTFLRGTWTLDDDASIGSGVGLNETYIGDLDWTDYTLSAVVAPLHGDAHGLLVRVHGAMRSYALALLPGRLALLRNDGGYIEVASTPFRWNIGLRYALSARVSGATLEGVVGPAGGAVAASVAWTDPWPRRSGMIGLANQRGCRTAFRDVSVRS